MYYIYVLQKCQCVIIYCCIQTSIYHSNYVHIACVTFLLYRTQRRKIGRVLRWITSRMRHIFKLRYNGYLSVMVM
jgi:hypothetical protein